MSSPNLSNGLRVALAVAMACILASCELFLDINDDDGDVRPNDPPDASPFPVDAAPPDASAFCTFDSSYLDIGVPGSRYRVLGGFTLAAGQTRCREDGADLISLNDSSESTAVFSFIAGFPTHVNCNTAPCAWVGLQQVIGNPTNPDSGWLWPDGTQREQLWATGQPDDEDDVEDGVEQCAMLDADGLRDESCEIETFTICECAVGSARTQ